MKEERTILSNLTEKVFTFIIKQTVCVRVCVHIHRVCIIRDGSINKKKVI